VSGEATAARGDAALLAERDAPSTVWGRRCVTVSAVVLCFAVALVTAPLWIPLAAVTDALSRGRRSALACGLFLVTYLACEVWGLLAAAALWAAALVRRQPRDGEAFLERNFRLQNAWAGALLRGASRILGFRLEAEGTGALAGGPMLLLPRHASVADTLLASAFVSRPHQVRLRYVIKRELLWDPCLDVVGNRLPNYFVRRGSGDSAREVHGIRALARGLAPREGLLLYPEGTRFSPAKRERAIARLRSAGHGELARRAEGLRHVLPPKLGGALALLEEAPGLDAVFCAHTGFEPVESFWQIWHGALRGTTVRVAFWRVPARDIPEGREARTAWLYEQWQRVDDWIGAARRDDGRRPEA